MHCYYSGYKTIPGSKVSSGSELENRYHSTNGGSELENRYHSTNGGRYTLTNENGVQQDSRQNEGYSTFNKSEFVNGGLNGVEEITGNRSFNRNMEMNGGTGINGGVQRNGDRVMNGGRGMNGGLIKRELPEPPPLPPPDYNETMAARNKVNRGIQ